MFGTLQEVLANEKQLAILEGNCRKKLRLVPDRSIHLVITSPPYWKQRSYEGPGKDQIGQENAYDCENRRCGECYVCHLLAVFREVYRVLRDDGNFILNIGDTYSEKNLLGLPWRVAFALQSEGWALRSALPWIKRSAMVSSVKDRPASSLEYVFQLVKSDKYYFDMTAIRKVSKMKPNEERYQKNKESLRGAGGWISKVDENDDRKYGGTKPPEVHPDGRGFRDSDLWLSCLDPEKSPYGMVSLGDELVGLDVVSEPLYDEHYAAYPTGLVSPFIRACTSERGICQTCNKPWRRVTKEDKMSTRPGTNSKVTSKRVETNGDQIVGNRDPERHLTSVTTLGWKPTCKCYCSQVKEGTFSEYEELEAIPAIVLDPFVGSGTTAVVAQLERRRCIGIELSPKYIEIAEKRVRYRGKQFRPSKQDKAFPEEGF